MSIVLSERFAQEENYLTKMDPRLKLIFCLSCLVLVVWNTKPLVNLFLGITLLIGLLAVRVNLKYVLLRMVPGLIIASLLVFTQLFWKGQTPLAELSLSPWQLVIYKEGLDQGLLLGSRVLAGLAVMVFLSGTTTIGKLIFAAHWFRVPKTLLEMITIAYRYVFVLLEEMQQVYCAQRMRMGYQGWHKSMRSAGALGGIVILRAFDRAERLYRSMCCRGYSGELQVNYEGSFTKNDALLSLVLASVLGTIILIGI